MEIKERISALRKEMQSKNIDAFIIYSADPHMSEYLPTEWQERAWLSGFTGSAGFVVITKDKGGLWTDSRYFLQADTELKDSGIALFKEGVEGTPDYISWILEQTPENGKVAVNALATSHSNWKTLKNKLKAKSVELVDEPLLKEIWKDRAKGEKINQIFVQPDKWAGKSVSEKLKAIRESMEEQNATTHVITALDDVAWTLNLRGSDVSFNPVFLGYIVVSKEDVTLFVDPQKVTEEVKNHLQENNIKLVDYDGFFPFLKAITNEQVLISPNSNQAIFEALKDNNDFVEAPAPGNLMKATKNETELDGFREVMVRDGVSLVKFFYWLTHQAGKEEMNEFQIGERLREFRAEGKNFVGESFGSIVGYKGNGAIVHYSAKKDNCKSVTNHGTILIDSGGQYLEGTTDITRTFALGEIPDGFIKDSTLVLKGMIRLSMVRFPKGTRGVQLDSVARLPLWMHSKDYGHGTGHGVGSFMNVHEGPQNIRKDLNPQILLPGMVCSNEPGFYKENEYGIRHENLVTVKEVETTEFGTFYEFETLTICPFFTDTIDKSLLSEEEIKWLNDYHELCKEKLGTHLDGDVKEWFLELVKPI